MSYQDTIRERIISACILFAPWSTAWIFLSPVIIHNISFGWSKGILYVSQVLCAIAIAFSHEIWGSHLRYWWIRKTSLEKIWWRALLIFLIFSAFLSQEPWRALFVLYNFGAGVLLFLTLHYESSEVYSKRFAFFLFTFCASLVLMFFQVVMQQSPSSTLLGLSELHLNPGSPLIGDGNQLWLRTQGSFEHPVIAAMAMLWGGMLILTSSLCKRRLIQFLASIVYAFIIASTFSRSVLLISFVGIFFIFYFEWIKKVFLLKKLGLIILGFLCGVILHVILFFPQWQFRTTHSNVLEQRSRNERIEQFTLTPMLLSKGGLFGIGGGQSVLMTYSNSALSQPVHNTFFLLIIEWGIAGIMIIIFYIKILRDSWMQNDFWKFTSLMSIGVLGLFDHAIVTSWPLIVTLAIIAGLWRVRI